MQHRPRERDASIDQQGAERLAGEALGHQSARCRERREVSHVGDQRRHGGARLGAECCRVFGAAHGRENMPAFGGKPRDERMTDPARSAGDKRRARRHGGGYSAAVCFTPVP